jgi:hypothetical protein
MSFLSGFLEIFATNSEFGNRQIQQIRKNPITDLLAKKISQTSPVFPFQVNESTHCQGCQIFLGKTYQNGEKYTKYLTIQNGHKTYQMTTK